jgi:hypothetical protein
MMPFPFGTTGLFGGAKAGGMWIESLSSPQPMRAPSAFPALAGRDEHPFLPR